MNQKTSRKVFFTIVVILDIIVAVALCFYFYEEKQFKDSAAELKTTLYKYYSFSSLLCDQTGNAWQLYDRDHAICIDLATGTIAKDTQGMISPRVCTRNALDLVNLFIKVEKNSGAFLYADSLRKSADSISSQMRPLPNYKDDFEKMNEIKTLCNRLLLKATNPLHGQYVGGSLDWYMSDYTNTTKQIESLFDEVKQDEFLRVKEAYIKDANSIYDMYMDRLKKQNSD